MIRGERWGSNHSEMKELEVAAMIRNIDENVSFRAETSKNIGHNPRR